MLKIDEYIEQVLSGEIVACKKVKQACQRHLDDLEKSKSKDYPWYFDKEKALRPIKYIGTLCKPTQGIYENVILEPWTHFVVGSLFGWVHKETGLRRFKYGLIYLGRKNGKSLIAAGLSLYCCSSDGERGARVYNLANAMKQARLTYDESVAMVKLSPELKGHFRPLREAIYYENTNSKIEPQASDSERLDGLNCHFGVFDEIHEYKNYKLINVIKNSTASRLQPLIMYITTAGFHLDGPLMDYYEKGADVLSGAIDDERTLYYMAELDEEDDLDDFDNWIKANPNMGVSVQLEDMIEEWHERKLIPQERNDFITKRLNLFVCADEQSFVDFEVVKRNCDVLDVDALEGHNCIGGFDLSNTEDFTSACVEFPLEDGKVFVLSHSFVPERKVKLDNENLPFRAWEKEGLLTICRGDYVDYRYVYDWFIEQSEKYAINQVTYDPANAFRLVQDLVGYFGEDALKVVRQGWITLSPALKDIKELLLDGKAVFNNNRLLRWYINNIKLVDDRNGNWMPTKQGRYRKIDGFAAWLNAHTETMKLMGYDDESDEPVGFISRKQLLNG